MIDKIFISLLTGLVFVGVYHYDRHIREQGHPGLVSELIDYTGLASFKEPPAETRRSVSESFTLDIFSPGRLPEKVAAAHESRLELARKRRDILDQISGLDFDIFEEGRVYARAILAERARFFERFPDFESAGFAILAARNEPDPALRRQRYQELEDHLFGLLGTVTGDPAADTRRVRRLFETVQAMLAEIPDVVVAGCEDMDLAECVENAEDREAALREMIDTIVAGGNLALAFDFTELLFAEYEYFNAKYARESNRLRPNPLEIPSLFKDLVQGLDRTTVEGNKTTGISHRDLRDEHAMMTAFRDLDAARMKELNESKMRLRHQNDRFKAARESLQDRTRDIQNTRQNLQGSPRDIIRQQRELMQRLKDRQK